MDLKDDILPVLRHYLTRIDHYLGLEGIDQYLSHQVAEGVFSAGQHFATAQNMALRALYPSIGIELPKLSLEASGAQALRQRSQEIRGILLQTDWSKVTTVSTVEHRAGFAELQQETAEYVQLFALPNFIFHISSAHAALLNAGMKVGKSDFDGFHDYPPGFSWL